jgi:hypothetical protein
LPIASASAVSASASTAASATIHRRLLPPLVLHHQKQNWPKLFGGLRRSFL